jgi:UDP-N-acetylglucosamine acyltransferase
VIDPTCIIHPGAKIADDVTIGPWSYIGEDVTIGSGTIIGSHCLLKGPTQIGKNNLFHSFCSIGEDSQDMKFRGESAYLVIGDNNVIREFVTIHRGTADGGSTTRVGNHNLLMNYCHVAHDCQVGNHVVMSNNATLAGHVTVGDHVTFGGFAAVHQFVLIGSYSFIAARTAVFMDIIPFVMVEGARARVLGLNKIGLRRKGFSGDQLKVIQQAYGIIFRNNLSKNEAIEKLKPLIESCPLIGNIVAMMQASTRGISRESRDVNHVTS